MTIAIISAVCRRVVLPLADKASYAATSPISEFNIACNAATANAGEASTQFDHCECRLDALRQPQALQPLALEQLDAPVSLGLFDAVRWSGAAK